MSAQLILIALHYIESSTIYRVAPHTCFVCRRDINTAAGVKDPNKKLEAYKRGDSPTTRLLVDFLSEKKGLKETTEWLNSDVILDRHIAMVRLFAKR